MKKSSIFCFKSFNDIDHITPLLWYSVKNGDQAIVFWFGKQEIQDFPILDKLINTYHIPFYWITSSNKVEKHLKWNFISFYWFLNRHKVQRIIFDWFTPRFMEIKGQLFLAALLKRIKTYALPHGYFIYTNDQYNEKTKREKNIKSFKKRNWINLYYLNNAFQRDIFIKKGLKKEICRINGNMRFSKLWHDQLMKHHFKETTEKTKIIFFTPHWSYNVNKEKTLSLINKLIEKYSPNDFKISLHTRGSGSLDYEKYKEYILSRNTLSGQSIRNNDIIICFGSSIIFEGILQNKVIINPAYLHSNQTIYDHYEILNRTMNENETLDKVEEMLQRIDEDRKVVYDEILQKHVHINEQPIISFYDQIFKENK